MSMTAADRRFTSTLLLVFGPLFVLGGFLAAFTVEGALFVFLGLAMFVVGVLLRTHVPLSIAVLSGPLVFAGLVANMVRELRG